MLGLGLAVSATAIVARFVWVFPATYLPRFFSKSLRARDPSPPARAVFIISWAGMRGVVSLAAAFALPPDFPQRDLILFLTFCVIVATLVGQGLTLPWLIRQLGVTASPAGRRRRRPTPDWPPWRRRCSGSNSSRSTTRTTCRSSISFATSTSTRRSHVLPMPAGTLDEAEQELLDHRAIRTAVLVAQREAVIGLRDDGVINDETLRVDRARPGPRSAAGRRLSHP